MIALFLIVEGPNCLGHGAAAVVEAYVAGQSELLTKYVLKQNLREDLVLKNEYL